LHRENPCSSSADMSPSAAPQPSLSHIALFHICCHEAQSKERIDVYSASILAI